MVSLPSFTPNKLRPRADLNIGEFRKNILTHGMRTKWEMAAQCSCSRKLSLASDQIASLSRTISGDTLEKQPDCVACEGKGWLYHSAQEIKVVALAANRHPQRNAEGYIWADTPSAIKLSMLPEHLPGYNDRFTMLDNTMSYNDVVVRGDNPGTPTTVDILKYPVASRTLLLGDPADTTVQNITSVDILYCRKADLLGKMLDQELVKGTDFQVTSDGNIDWALGSQASTSAGGGGTIAFATNGEITRSTGSWITDGFKVGAHVVVANSPTSANNGTFHVTAITETTLTVNGATTLTAATGDTAVTFTGGMAPATGGRFTIHYYTHPVFIARTFPFIYRDTFVKTKAATPQFKNTIVRVDCWLEWLVTE